MEGGGDSGGERSGEVGVQWTLWGYANFVGNLGRGNGGEVFHFKTPFPKNSMGSH